MLYGGTLYTVIGYYLHPVIDTRIVCDTYYMFLAVMFSNYIEKIKMMFLFQKRISCTPLDPNIA